MENRIMLVFYGNDRLPYKDSSRTVHYPIVGSEIVGANNTSTIRFYVDEIGGVDSVTWVAVSKLPNGQTASEVLSTTGYDSDLDEYYVDLDLSSYYTSLKGAIYISLNGYYGGVEFTYDEDTGVYEVSGTPTILATGTIKILINYAPTLVYAVESVTADVVQQLISLVAGLDIDTGFIHILSALPSDLSDYSDDTVLAILTDSSLTLYRVDSSLDDGYEEITLGNYYTQTEIDNLLASYVDLTSDQTVAGVKTFSDTPIFASGEISDGTYTFTLPSATGTLALTDDITTALADYYTASEVDSLISTAISNVYQIKGSVVVTALNGLTKAEAMNGYVYNLTDDGDLINEDETTISVETGDNVVFIWNDGEWYWDKLAGTVDLSDYLSTSDYLTDDEIDTIYEEA